MDSNEYIQKNSSELDKKNQLVSDFSKTGSVGIIAGWWQECWFGKTAFFTG